MEIFYRIATIEDLKSITELSIFLHGWENNIEDEQENNKLLDKHNTVDLLNPQMAMFLAYDGDKAVGFSHVGIRHEPMVGKDDVPFGYLESVYVAPDYRKQGIAKKLVNMCENWSKEKECKQFVSGILPDNQDSINFHLQIGFVETCKVVYLCKVPVLDSEQNFLS